MPTIKFNSHTARLLDPEKKSIEYFVKDFNVGYPGSLGLRVSPKGKKTWFTMYRWDGSRIKYNLTGYPAASVSRATIEATKILADVAGGINPKQAKQDYLNAPTFNDLIPIYLEHHASKKKDSGYADKRMLAHSYLDPIRDMKAGDIRRKHIVAILSSPGLAGRVQGNRYLSLLRKFFSVCIRRDLLPELFVNPGVEVDRPGTESTGEEPFDNAQIAALLQSFEQMDAPVCTALQILLYTGCRATEIYGLRWDEVDMDAGLITLPGKRVKNGKAHQVPMSTQVKELLAAIRVDSEYVFPARNRKGHVIMYERRRNKIKKLSGVPGFKVKNLRTTVASGMGDLGIEDNTISRCLNHTIPGVTARHYNKSKYIEPKRKAFQLWANQVDRIQGIEVDNVYEIGRRQA